MPCGWRNAQNLGGHTDESAVSRRRSTNKPLAVKTYGLTSGRCQESGHFLPSRYAKSRDRHVSPNRGRPVPGLAPPLLLKLGQHLGISSGDPHHSTDRFQRSQTMKKRHRRLTLNRETIRNLDANHLHNVVGGAFTDQPDCDTHGPETGPDTCCNDTIGPSTLQCDTGPVECHTGPCTFGCPGPTVGSDCPG